MGAYTYLAHALTLIFGSILIYFLIGPLGLLVYLLIWVDIVILFRFVFIETIGFELITLSGIVGGIALGPIVGFFFALFGLPIISSILRVIHDGNFFEFSFLSMVPNFDILIIAFSAVLSGLLAESVPFIPLIVIAVLFKNIVINLINVKTGGPLTLVISAVNVAFSIAFAFWLQSTGLLNFFL